MATTHFIEDGRVAATITHETGSVNPVDLMMALEMVMHTVESAGGSARIEIRDGGGLNVVLEHPLMLSALLDWFEVRRRLGDAPWADGDAHG